MSKRVYGWAAEEALPRAGGGIDVVYIQSEPGRRYRATAYGLRSEREGVQHADKDDDTQRLQRGEHECGWYREGRRKHRRRPANGCVTEGTDIPEKSKMPR